MWVPYFPVIANSPFSHKPGSLGTGSFKKPSSLMPGDGFHGGFSGECWELLKAWEEE